MLQISQFLKKGSFDQDSGNRAISGFKFSFIEDRLMSFSLSPRIFGYF